MAKNKRQRLNPKLLLLVPVGLAVLGGISIISLHRYNHTEPQLVIDGNDVSSLSQEEAKKLLQDAHPWKLTLTYENRELAVDDSIEPAIDSLTESAYKNFQKMKDEKDLISLPGKISRGLKGAKAKTLTYELTLDNTDKIAQKAAEKASKEWNVTAKNAAMESYDAESGTFKYSAGVEGLEVDEDKLIEDLKTALESGEYDREIAVTVHKAAPEVSESDYKLIGTYTTHTTANPDRNTNVRLACEAINGLILPAGEQFSFNGTVGERTPEKGYKEAAAYSMEEVVQEYGGGVCQVSSTLYNAVIAAGLQTDVRTGHVFKPTYVTPGQDATVSYSEPDFAFTNSSSNTIGIKANYWDQTVVVEVYGVPVLEEGVIRYLHSEKKADLDPPKPTYEEDTSLKYGEEVVSSPGESGSEWVTDIVTEKNGEVIDRTFLHNTRYSGHAAVIRRNTTVKDEDKEKEKEKDKKKKSKKDDSDTEEPEAEETPAETEPETEAPAEPEPEPEPEPEAPAEPEPDPAAETPEAE